MVLCELVSAVSVQKTGHAYCSAGHAVIFWQVRTCGDATVQNRAELQTPVVLVINAWYPATVVLFRRSLNIANKDVEEL